MPLYRVTLAGAKNEPIEVEANNAMTACARAVALRLARRLKDGTISHESLIAGYSGFWSDVVSVSERVEKIEWQDIPLS